MAELEEIQKKLHEEIETRKHIERRLEQIIRKYDLEEEIGAIPTVDFQSSFTDLKEQRLPRHEVILDQVNDIIYTIDFNGIITYVNATGLRLAPVSKENFIGLHFSVFVRNDYRNIVQQVFDQIRATGVTNTYFEFPLQFPSGQVIWLGQNTSLIESEDSDPYLLLVARDITRQKEIEFERNRIRKQIEASEMKYRSIMENMKLGLVEVNISGEITKAYPSFCRMVDYMEEELIGRKPEDFLFIEETRKYLDTQGTLWNQKQEGLSEIQIKTRNHDEIWALVSETPFFDLDGNITGYISIHYDITSIKNLQKDLIVSREIAEKAQLAQKQFLATMSHEIRTPLNAIIGMSHILADTNLDQEQTETLEIIISSTNILKSLISDILDISKIDSGNVEAQADPMDLAKLFQALEKIFTIKLGKKQVDLVFDLDKRLNYQVVGDELLLNQIFMNLLSNAVKFTHNGKICIQGLIVEETEEFVDVRFSINDSGIGITEDQLRIIFDQFKQAHRKIQDEYGGTGLGLAITKKLVEILGGKIEVKSELGSGSEFWFDLRFGRTALPVETEVRAMGSLGQEFHFPYPILVVEDNAMNQKYIGKLLDKWKIDYQIANNGVEGVELAVANKFCLILMDLQMPVMDGFKATQLIRKSENPLLRNIPIVALTASTLLNKREEVLQAGMNEYLSKPFTPEQLAAIFNKCCQLYGEKYLSLLDNGKTFTFSPVFDRDYLDELYGDDFEYTLEMFEIFSHTIPSELEHLTHAINDLDYIKVSQIVHKIKPTFNMVGLKQGSKVLLEIESLANAGDDQIKDYENILKVKMQELLPIIDGEIARIRKYMEGQTVLSESE